jgi:hypothetical protein
VLPSAFYKNYLPVLNTLNVDTIPIVELTTGVFCSSVGVIFKHQSLQGRSSIPATPPLSEWGLAKHLIIRAKKGVILPELSRQIGVSYIIAWRMKHKLTQVVSEKEDATLSGRVEVHYTYLCCRNKGNKIGRCSHY